MLRGTPLLYYGDEIGMREIEVPREQLRDPVGIRHWPEDRGRDRSRTPMQWDRTGGFTRDGVEPWLPMGDAAERNVADQREDPASMLHLCRDLIAVRRGRADLRSGASAPHEAPVGVWAWRRGDATLVAVNHGDALGLAPGRRRHGADRDRSAPRRRARLRRPRPRSVGGGGPGHRRYGPVTTVRVGGSKLRRCPIASTSARRSRTTSSA